MVDFTIQPPYRIDELTELAILSNSTVRPDTSWLNSNQIRQVRHLIDEIRPKCAEYNSIRNELLTHYDDSFFELDIDKLIKRFSSIWWRNKFVRWFNPLFHKDKADILRTTRNPELPSTISRDLHQARRLNLIRQEFENNRSRNSALLGVYDQGFRTDFDLVDNALQVAADVVRLAHVSPVPENLVQLVAYGYPPQVDLNVSANQIREGVRQWEATVQPFSSLIRMGQLPSIGSGFRQANLSAIEQWVRNSLTSLRSLCELTEAVLTNCIAQRPNSLPTLLADLDKNEQWRSLLSQLDAASDSLSQRFRNRYCGLDTNWVELLNALDWTKQARKLLNNRVPEQFIQLATKQDNRAIPFEPVVSGYNSVVELCETIQQRFSPEQLTTCGTPYQEVPLSAIGARAYTLQENLDLLELWVNYTAIKTRFISLRFDEFLRKLQQISSLPPASQISDIFYKSVYQAWINAIFDQDSNLTDFYGREHEQVIKDFRDCDKKLIELAKQRIINECNQRKRKYISTASAQQEIALLKKRGKEIRRLFEDIPNLLLKLKPCLMMSPASVSKFINLQKINFDVVIFDEASQLSTEEAVGAVCRGKQFIVAGDNQQLPPTSFFKSTFVVDEDDEEEDDLPPDFKSLLAECETILRRVSLKWHYRSKHESLIAFSNEKFYGGQLITFPAKESEPGEDLGVKFIHVPDGVYDGAKGKKKNLIEAQKVVEEIFKHFTRYPYTEPPHRRSIGVVTFNEPQMDAVKEVLEKQLEERSEFNRFFGEDLLEGFFVKNLENVQGDERDVIILTIGYGPDPQGRVYSRFGPITQEGGHKRLNVAITRARQKFIVVSSITYGQINIRETSKPGLLNLYDYLRYAQHGPTALALTNPLGAEEFDSPFEEDVANEIRALGYLVTPQVGCSGYRIDIGVSHQSHPGYFLLGVECDGATYHSAATARDRDRLRQQVLEKLGWKIHRIWSPDWWKRRTREIERLSQVLQETYQIYLGNSSRP